MSNSPAAFENKQHSERSNHCVELNSREVPEHFVEISFAAPVVFCYVVISQKVTFIFVSLVLFILSSFILKP